MQEFGMSEQSAFDPISAELVHLLPPDAAPVLTDGGVLDRLKHELRMAPLLAQGRAEVGGILRGTSYFENGRRILSVHGIQPVPCSYASGPTWTLTVPERLELEKMLRISPPGEPGLGVLGFYRSNIRVGTAPSKEDLELYSAYFPGQDTVVMILGRPYGADLGIVYYARETRISVPAGPVRQAQPARHGVQMPRELPPPDERRLLPMPAGRDASRPWIVGLVSAAAAVLLTVMALLGYNLWRAGRTTGTGSPLALQIESHSGQLLIRWDAASRLVAFARRGHITIRDGVDFHDFELSAAQVRSGKLVYLPASNNLDLRLDVEQPDGRRVGESVIFLAPPELMTAGGGMTMPEISAAPPLGYPPQATGRSQPATGKSADIRLSANAALPPRAGLSDTPPGRQTGAPPPLVPRISPDGLRPPAQTAKTPAPDAPAPARRAPPVQAAALPSASRAPSAPPPSIQPPPDPENGTGRALSQQAVPEPEASPAPGPAAITPAAPKPLAPTPPPQASPDAIPAEPAPAPPGIQPSPPVADNAPPEPIRQVSPVVPPQTRKLMHTPVEIQVKVSIDEYGKVTHAAIAGTKGPLAKFLTSAALSAAYEWQFKPARANGHALPSDKLIVFSFSSKP
jgi:hypothetical protein